MASQRLSPAIPTFEFLELEIGGHPWKLEFYEEYSPLLSRNLKELAQKLAHHCDPSFSSHRFQLSLEGVPLLVGVFNGEAEEKSIGIYSPRLGRELFLIEQIQLSLNSNKETPFFENLADVSHYQRFKAHAEKVASLSEQKAPSQYQLTTKKYGLVDILNAHDFQELEKKIQKKAQDLISFIAQYKSSFFEKISDYALDLTARYALIRIHLLKFLAILPSLDYDITGHEVKKNFREALRRLLSDSVKARLLKKKGQQAPLGTGFLFLIKGLLLTVSYLPEKILAALVRKSVRLMAQRFIAGESIESVSTNLEKLFLSGRDVTLDQLGELVVSEKEADHYCEEVIKLINGLGAHIPKGQKNGAGIYRSHVSVKVTALCSDFKPQAPDYTFNLVAPRLQKILKQAKDREVFIHIDAEHYHYRDLVLDIYARVLLETPELADYQQTGIVLQAYLRDSFEHLQEIIQLAKKRGLLMPIRLVKGAYWDAETVEADAHSFEAPEFLNKEETDLNFRQMVYEILKRGENLQLCLASHNFQDHCYAETLREELFAKAELPPIEHQCLHMTYEALSEGLAKMGWPTRNYVPVGSLLVGMAYLVRRIMENSSQVGVLTIMRSHKKASRILDPMSVHRENLQKGLLQRGRTSHKLTSEFFNITPLRPYLKEERLVAQRAYEDFLSQKKGHHYENKFLSSPKKERAKEKHQIFSSSDPDFLVGSLDFFSPERAREALERSEKAYGEGPWPRSSWVARSSILLKAADLMLLRRNELAALISYEAGKAVVEAYADVDEAIDFLNFYSREEQKISSHSEDMVSRGPIAVIAPWNFPLAIPTGMVSGALIAGNTVVLKSAQQTPLVAQVMVDLLHEAGVPEDVLIHVSGEGRKVGQVLVDDEKVAGYVFTGSREVGQMISHQTSRRFYENKLWKMKFPVKAITELGGKNAIIVTGNAELDETVSGILYSAFAHAGQKCSAASRVIVDGRVKGRLISRLKQAVSDLEVSEAFKMSCSVNPVISAKDQERLREQMKKARIEAETQGGKVIIDRSHEDLPGYCVGPAIIELPKKAVMKEDSYARRELFGPVLHIIGFYGLDEALEIFHQTDYALTGGVFSQSQDDIDYLTKGMECGNIYVNRSITGARVGIEPFGGFKMSGTGPKAGGKLYIPAFHIQKKSEEAPVVRESEGKDSTLELASPSHLGVAMRVDRVSLALKIFLNHFEQHFQGIRGEDKRLLLKFQKWMEKNALSHITGQHKNTEIPGQMSYNDFSMVGEHALFIGGTEIPSLSIFMQMVAGVLMGTGVTILCSHEKSFLWWSSVQETFYQGGISKENFLVYHPKKSSLVEILKNPLINYFFVDGDEDFISQMSALIFGDESEERSYRQEKRVRQLFSPFDCFPLEDFKRLCSLFTWVRAFAVNTMRHGAPLELDLDVDLY